MSIGATPYRLSRGRAGAVSADWALAALIGLGPNRSEGLTRISNLIQTSRPSGGLERLYS